MVSFYFACGLLENGKKNRICKDFIRVIYISASDMVLCVWYTNFAMSIQDYFRKETGYRFSGKFIQHLNGTYI